MLTSRIAIPDQIFILEDRGFQLLKIFLNSKRNQKKSLNVNGVILEFSNVNRIKVDSYLVFAVMCAILTIYLSSVKNQKFSASHILKILRGNKLARFSKISKKLETITETMIQDAIISLLCIKIQKLETKVFEEGKNLLQIKTVKELYSFEDVPIILDLIDLLNIQNRVFSLDLFNLYTITGVHLHETIDFINFKFHLLSLLVAEDVIEININEIKKVLKIESAIQKAKNDFVTHKISKTIYNQRMRECQQKLDWFINQYFQYLKVCKVIKSLNFNNEQLAIYK